MMKKALLAAILAVATALALPGCATTNDAYYSAIKADIEARSRDTVARAQTESARVTAIAQIAATGGEASRTAAVLALAMQGSGAQPGAAPQVILPPPKSTGESIWTAFLQVADVGLRAWGIKVGGDVAIRQSDNAANTAIASYQALQGTAGAGFNATTAIAGYIQAPQPNNTYTLSGTGVLGDGTYTYTGPVTRTCTGGPAGNGGGTTTGAPGGAGGNANC